MISECVVTFLLNFEDVPGLPSVKLYFNFFYKFVCKNFPRALIGFTDKFMEKSKGD